MKVKLEKLRTYIVTAKEVKEKLGLEGSVGSIILFAGRTPDGVEKGKSPDADEYEIVTVD